MCLYTIVICIGGMTTDTCLSELLTAISVVYYWMNICYLWYVPIMFQCGYCTDMDVLYPCSWKTVSLHPLSHKITRCGF